jgi:hypothetical protein
MKRLTTIMLIGILLIAGCGNSSSTGNKALDGELELESNQSLVVAQVTAIYGNEVTLALAKEVDESETRQQMENESSDNNAQDESASSEVQDTSSEQQEATANEQKPSGDNLAEESQSNTENNTSSESDVESGKGMPSGDNQSSGNNMPSGEMPSGENTPSKDMPEGGQGSRNEDSTDKSESQSQTQMTRYSLTGEETTMMIPVGTPVTTLLGTVTTFSRIAVDNTLKIVTEKNDAGEDTIVAIYIVG